MNLAVLGINFKTAPLEVRERVSFGAAEVPGLLQRLAARFPGTELVLVSTCNRTELYLAGQDLEARRPEFLQALWKDATRPPPTGSDEHFYSRSGVAAAQHLYAVVSGLDSMVVGETEILGQVKQGYTFAEQAGSLGRLLNPLFQNAFRCAKRVHAETDLARGRVSVSSLAVEFAEKVFADLRSKTIMIVGAGETAELALKSLVERGARDVLVLNRSLERGQALAERCGGRAIQFELLADYLPRADIVVSSTSAPHVVITAAAVRRAMAVRRSRPALLIDIAVPRDIDPAAAEVKDVYLYHIDDLQRLAEQNLARRREAVDAAWGIVRQVAAEFVDQSRLANIGDLMRRLDERGRAVCEELLDRHLAKEKLATLPEPAREEIRLLAQKIVNKLLAPPREGLRRAARNERWDEYSKTVSDLFGFDRPEEDRKGGGD